MLAAGVFDRSCGQDCRLCRHTCDATEPPWLLQGGGGAAGFRCATLGAIVGLTWGIVEAHTTTTKSTVQSQLLQLLQSAAWCWVVSQLFQHSLRTPEFRPDKAVQCAAGRRAGGQKKEPHDAIQELRVHEPENPCPKDCGGAPAADADRRGRTGRRAPWTCWTAVHG